MLVVSNGQELLEKALSAEPDLIISDVNMPKMTGIRAAKEILAKIPNQKIILASSDSDGVIVPGCTVLPKGDPGRLMDAIRNALS